MTRYYPHPPTLADNEAEDLGCIAEMVAWAAEEMGLRADWYYSQSSEAVYVVVWPDVPPDEEGVDDTEVTVRIAEHEPKPWNGGGSFEVGSFREGWGHPVPAHRATDGDWRAAVRWLAKRFDAKVPPAVAERLESRWCPACRRWVEPDGRLEAAGVYSVCPHCGERIK